MDITGRSELPTEPAIVMRPMLKRTPNGNEPRADSFLDRVSETGQLVEAVGEAPIVDSPHGIRLPLTALQRRTSEIPGLRLRIRLSQPGYRANRAIDCGRGR